MNMTRKLPALSLALLLPALAAGSAGASWNLSANLDLETRLFADDPRWSGQDDATLQYGNIPMWFEELHPAQGSRVR